MKQIPTILTNHILYGKQYVEALIGAYPATYCDTKKEVLDFLKHNNVRLDSKGYELRTLPSLFANNTSDTNYVFVEFSKEENYTEHETLLMPVPKTCCDKAKEFLANEFQDEPNIHNKR